MIINNAYELGQIVYHKTDVRQEPYIITGISIAGGDTIVYRCSVDGEEKFFGEFEILGERDEAMALLYKD